MAFHHKLYVVCSFFVKDVVGAFANGFCTIVEVPIISGYTKVFQVCFFGIKCNSFSDGSLIGGGNVRLFVVGNFQFVFGLIDQYFVGE
jgi:hypothetical protein